MNVVGLDLSLSRSGIAVPGRCYSVTPKQKGPGRLSELRSAVYRAVHDSDADVVVKEAVVPGPNALSGQALAKAHAVAELVMWDLRVPWFEVWPVHLKQWAGVSTKAGKDEMLAMARGRCLGAVPDHDAADAWWCWTLGMEIVGRPMFVANAKQRTVLAKVAMDEGLRRRVRMAVGA